MYSFGCAYGTMITEMASFALEAVDGKIYAAGL